MKIYNKIVMSMDTGEILYEDSFDFNGDVVLCKGGGGASGSVDFPTYMKTVHSLWLDDAGVDTADISITDAMNSAFSNSPFSSATAYNPDTALATMLGYITSLSSDSTYLMSSAEIGTLVNRVLDDTYLQDLAELYDTDLSDQLDVNTIPQFEAGMRDINSVMSSAFVIGKAIIQSERVKQSAQFLAQLRLKAGTDDIIKLIGMKLQFSQVVAQFGIEANRIKIVAKQEENTTNIKFDESDAKWDLEVFQYGNNVLASISGAAHYVPNKEGSSTQSAIGGALTGAATGAMMGSAVPGIGTTVGAVGGAVLGLGASLL